MIQLNKIRKEWDSFQLNNVSFSIEKGDYFVILGPSAAGKTVLLELIAGLLTPDSGNIFFKSVNANEIPVEKRNIGFVYQDYALFPHLSVKNNIYFGSHYQGRNVSIDHFEHLTKALNIESILHRSPKSLSGGEMQRTALARALLIQPDVLLLDEPLSSLDTLTKSNALSLLRNVHKQFGLTTIHITHDQEEAINIADKIAVILNGNLVQIGTPEEIFQRPVSKEVAEFLGVENIFSGTISDEKDGLCTVQCGDIEICVVSDLSKNDTVRVCIRPENITVLLKNAQKKSSARNILEGTISNIELSGYTYKMTISLPFPVKTFITKQSFEDMNLKLNTPVKISFKATAVHLIKTKKGEKNG